MTPDEPYRPWSIPPAEDDGINWLGAEEIGPEPEDVEVVDCWRCGKEVEASYRACPFCRARLVDEEPHPRRGGHVLEPRRADALATLIYFALGLLATSAIFGWIVHNALPANGPPNGEKIRKLLALMTVFDVIGALVVGAAVYRAGRPPALPLISRGRQAVAWVAMIPAFAVLLAANFAYFHLLKDVLQVPQIEDVFTKDKGLIPWVLLTMCVQPAIVEELFFRYLAIGHFRQIMGTQGAIWLTAAMFGLFHIFNLLGMPYLILAGAFFGYARVYGRSMALPMLLHFAHNVIVLWFNPWP